MLEVSGSHHHDHGLDGVPPTVPRVPHHPVVSHGLVRPLVVMSVQVPGVTPATGKRQETSEVEGRREKPSRGLSPAEPPARLAVFDTRHVTGIRISSVLLVVGAEPDPPPFVLSGRRSTGVSQSVTRIASVLA